VPRIFSFIYIKAEDLIPPEHQKMHINMFKNTNIYYISFKSLQSKELYITKNWEIFLLQSFEIFPVYQAFSVYLPTAQ